MPGWLMKLTESRIVQIVTFVLLIPVLIFWAFAAMIALYPDAGPGAMVFLFFAPPVGLVLTGVLALLFWLLRRKQWLRTSATLLTCALLLVIGTVVNGVAAFSSPDLQAALKPTCEITNPKPGQDLGDCTPAWSIKPEQTPAAQLFAGYGWTAGASGDEKPLMLPVKPHPTEQARLDFSKDIGLDFSPLAGTEVRELTFFVKPASGNSAAISPKCMALQAHALLDQQRNVACAWLLCRGNSGGPPSDIPGYSLKGRDIQQISGITWSAYQRKYR